MSFTPTIVSAHMARGGVVTAGATTPCIDVSNAARCVFEGFGPRCGGGAPHRAAQKLYCSLVMTNSPSDGTPTNVGTRWSSRLVALTDQLAPFAMRGRPSVKPASISVAVGTAGYW